MTSLLFVGFGLASVWLATRFMLPMLAVRLAIGELLAADTATLAPATLANKIALITAPFVLQESLVIGDLTLASTGGLAPLAGTAGAQAVAIDPSTLDQVIQIKPPAGGYRWVTSGATYPTTVYGYALVDNGATNLLAAQQLQVPVTFTADGQFIEVDPVEMTFVVQPVS